MAPAAAAAGDGIAAFALSGALAVAPLALSALA